MGVEVRPLGVRCNIQCLYCYQQPERETGNAAREYDLERIREAIEAEGQEFTLFGGDPLLVPERDLEELWALGLERFGRNGVQTNGSLINERHLELFRRYNVHVGISIDGPGELNDARWAGTLAKTREATRRTEESIARLCREESPPSLIVTLHRLNASVERRPALREWIRRLDSMGVRDARLHLLEVDHPDVARTLALDPEENLAAMLDLLALEPELVGLRFDGFREMRRLLLADDEKITCTWRACDPLTTRAVRGIEGNGQRSNCGRTNKDGIDFVKASSEGFERYLALYETPQEAGGCRDCRFFLACKGQCPGTAIDGDWRNRTVHCSVWMGLLERIESEIEREGGMPLSKDPIRPAVERVMIEAWAVGRNLPLRRALDEARRRGERPATLRKPSKGHRIGPAERLDFRLPENVRIAWVSDEARRAWEPRMQRILTGWRELELLSVRAGLRRCAAVPAGPEELVRLAGRATELGLVALPVELQAQASSYRNASSRPRIGEPWLYRVVLGLQADVEKMKAAWDAADDVAIGDMLGYPECCRRAFFQAWVEDGLIDNTFPMARAAAGAEGARDEALLLISGPPHTNLMWRWTGLRPVFHLPCSDVCARTRDLSRDLLACWRDAGYRDEADWLVEILSWPIEWTALHGIAEIKTPILKIVATTDATATRLVVRRSGSRLPPEAPQGLGFAYRDSPTLVTLSRRYRAGHLHAGAST